MKYPVRIHSLVAVLLVSCGGSEAPPPKLAEAPAEVESSGERERIEVTGEVGGLNETKVNRAFEHALAGLKKCINDGARRVEYIAGDVGFQIEVERGGTSSVFVDQSTLGDRATEKCMVGVLTAQSWPKPVGGEKGQAHKSFSFDSPKAVRPPVEWSADDVKEEVAKLGSQLEQCKDGQAGAFTATLYVDTSGQPLAAGVASPSSAADGAADCIVRVLMSAKYRSPGSWAAKVSIQL
jgi:hypothetical protein